MRVTIIGAGVVGAAIAYELSLVSGLQTTLLDAAPQPGQGATGAALGVLMGAISRKTKGRAWRLRQRSLERFETLIPELELLTGQTLGVNRQGIVLLQGPEADLEPWRRLQALRQSQGYRLDLWDQFTLEHHCPQVVLDKGGSAIYSPQDCQISPTLLTQALITAAQRQGVDCRFGVACQPLDPSAITTSGLTLMTSQGPLETDLVIVTAGLASSALTPQALSLQPVIGQALEVRVAHPLGRDDFQPVLSYQDVHIVPLTQNRYWVGATVEFPAEEAASLPTAAQWLEQVWQTAVSFCPALETAEILRQWSGQRPRPLGESAPVIRPLPGYAGVLLATGHYRNGVLLAPATALEVRDWVLSQGNPGLEGPSGGFIQDASEVGG
ncbi:FAD-dependent oxidoreductase [Synechocystis sp. LKSZ1]|uniref:NAD(P)/FAD-dependent oxidoreductase n=1 Tax=Synechocystis sp. LKSZ1 TaxID=3144951 RepID=UPI00336C0B6F